MQSLSSLQTQFNKHKDILKGQELKRPKNWGAIYINPIRIEFMEFKQRRLHERILILKNNLAWEMKVIQP